MEDTRDCTDGMQVLRDGGIKHVVALSAKLMRS